MKIICGSYDPVLHQEAINQAALFGEAITLDFASLPDDDSATIAAAVVQAAEAEGADLILLGASKRGKDVAPRVAALLDIPFAGEVQSLKEEGGKWIASRMVLSGNSLATYDLGTRAVVSFTQGTFDAPQGEARIASVDVPPSKVKIVGHEGAKESDFDLSSSDYVVGVGRGFKAKEDIKLAEAVANKLQGGAVGCSRPVAADLKWLSEEHWIGLSGHEIKPKVYFAAGVSGQIQHVAGIRGSKLIVAINTNKDAPIFQIADYGIVGDLYKILPELADAL